MNFNYYVGKVCTVMVTPTALPIDHYTEKQMMLQFSGVVDLVDSRGIQLSHLAYGTKNFFFFPHVIGICEEQVLNEDDPQVEIIKGALTDQEKDKPTTNDSAFMDIQTLQNIAAQSKR